MALFIFAPTKRSTRFVERAVAHEAYSNEKWDGILLAQYFVPPSLLHKGRCHASILTRPAWNGWHSLPTHDHIALDHLAGFLKIAAGFVHVQTNGMDLVAG